MPQEMNVLCCYSCKMFQVHIVKKARKWQCKLCNAKQSVQQIYLQGSGRDCRLYVQQLNSLKANDIASLIAERNNTSDNYSASASISHESNNDKAAESKWAKYLDSSEKENLFHAQDLASCNIQEAEDEMPRKTSPCDDVNNDSNFENVLDDSSSETENITDNYETKNLQSTNCDHNSDPDKCNLQVNSKFSKEFSDVTNIFETNEELDEPLDF
ncbi:hypothetical protein DMN91_010812 [Ooceraea biroi]|uniref:MRN complex-interacting protein N-terminal domain-containing protein n=1 Tax=Ooceraea biroi TaxID=2015173 RepID=A0A026WWJ4_OOCBI|nr:MRN complex-interacting protein [Ooceraea biroi]EZA60188.1 hypothetical protein X777_13276 [Ooceraea biroi]RLU16744.1 hypothetical protein DMN91_010812 [Ooceraea biroi]